MSIEQLNTFSGLSQAAPAASGDLPSGTVDTNQLSQQKLAEVFQSFTRLQSEQSTQGKGPLLFEIVEKVSSLQRDLLEPGFQATVPANDFIDLVDRVTAAIRFLSEEKTEDPALQRLIQEPISTLQETQKKLQAAKPARTTTLISLQEMLEDSQVGPHILTFLSFPGKLMRASKGVRAAVKKNFVQPCVEENTTKILQSPHFRLETAPQICRNDKLIAISSVWNRPEEFQFLSDKLKNDIGIVKITCIAAKRLTLIERRPDRLQQLLSMIPPSVRQSEVMQEFFRTLETIDLSKWLDQGEIFEELAAAFFGPPTISLNRSLLSLFQNDRELLALAVRQHGCALRFASRELRKNSDIVALAVQQDGGALQYASEKLGNNPEIVALAVQQNGLALQYASEEPRNNPEIVALAVQQNGWALRYVSDELRNNSEIVALAVRQTGWALEFASREPRNNSDIVALALKDDGQMLQFASPELKNTPAIVAMAVQRTSEALQWASLELRNNPEIVTLAVRKNGMTLQYASEELRNNPEIVALAMRENGWALKFASDELQNNPDIVALALKDDGQPLQFASPELKNTPAIVALAVQRTSWALQWASLELRNNPEIVTLAVRKNGMTLQYASKELRNNREIVTLAVRQTGWALQFASDELRTNKELIALAESTKAKH